MPVNACSKDGKPGFKFGESGTCYTYNSNDPASRKRAKEKAHQQEVAARASGWTEKSIHENGILKEIQMQIQLPYDNATEIKKQHDSMAAWHQSMAESHSRAAGWHASQSETLTKALNEVPLDPTKLPSPGVGAHGVPTGEPPSPQPPTTNVPLDPVKKSEFVQILRDHADLFSNLGEPIDKIAQKLLGE